MPRNKSGLFMGTTRVEANQTVGEIVGELVKAGAKSINTDYQNGKITGIRWIMRVGTTDQLFDMPIRIEPVLKKLGNREQAERVAWRQLLRWVQAQNAMIDCGMADPAEVYFGYFVPDPQNNRTLFAQLMERQFKALPPPS